MPRPIFVQATVLFFVGVLGACGSPSTPIAQPPSLTGTGKCPKGDGPVRPLVVDWPEADRASLESAIRRGLVVVRYRGCEVEVLTQCRLPGGYDYSSVTPKNNTIQMRNADDLWANVPIGAARLSATLSRVGELNAHTTIVGNYVADRLLGRDELVGACEGATHVVTETTMGAFKFHSGASANIGAEGSVGTFGAGGKSGTQTSLLAEEGDRSTCSRATQMDKDPPWGCGGVVWVSFSRIPEHAPPQVVSTPVTATEPLGRAREYFQRRDYWSAAVNAYEVMQDKARPKPEKDEGQHLLAESFNRIGMFNAAFSIVAEIAEDSKHTFRKQSLKRLAGLSVDAALGDDVVERMGKYSMSEFDDPELASIRGDLLFMLARYRMRNRNYDDARRMVASIPKSSASYWKAQLLAGIASENLLDANAALRAYEPIVTATRNGVSAETRALGVIAESALGRVRNAPLGGKAHPLVDSYGVDAISLSERFSGELLAGDLAFETAFIRHFAGDDAGALSALSDLRKAKGSNVASNALLFEAYLLWRKCRYDEAAESLDTLERVYPPLVAAARKTIATELDEKEDDEDARAKRWSSIARGTTAPPSPIAPWVEATRARPSVHGVIAYLDGVERERARLSHAPESWKISKLEADVKDMLQLSADISVRNVTEVMKNGLQLRVARATADLKSAQQLRDAVAAGRKQELSPPLRSLQACR